ncbi:hypothetical protein F6Y04_06445 [Bacillus megaterium]|nr:hypothetical protein [Priestia megaterium]
MNRIRLLDILRGFAIIGTLGTNIWLFSALTNKQNNYFLGTNALWWDSFDSFLSTLFLFLVNGKLLGMLTILFGVGLEIKYQQALRRKWMWPGIYIWGSVLLFLDGILHYIFVIEADVLMSYGVTAIIVSFLAKLHEDRLIKWFYGIGVFHLINVVLLTVTTALFPLGNLTDMISSSVYSAGSWVDQWIYRVENFWVLRAEAIFIIPQNICLFIVGILLMRNKVFTVKTGIRTNIRRKLLTLGYVAVPLNLLSFLPYEFVFFQFDISLLLS